MLRINLTRLNEIIFYIIGIILVITSLKSSLKTIIFFDNLRLVLIFSLFCLIPISLLKLKNDKTLIQNIFLLLLIGYGIVLNSLYIQNSKLLIEINNIILLSFNIVFFYYLLQIKKFTDQARINQNFFIFFVVITSFFLIFDGFNFQEIKFNFDIEKYSNEKYDKISYSHGLTKVFSLAAITSIYLLLNCNIKKNFFQFFLYFIFFGIFMFFVFCGGAIGEIFFCIVIIIFMLFRSLKKQFLLSNLIIFISILILLSIDLTDIYVFRRFNVFLETVNIRRIELAILSLNILKNEPHCLIIGCGFNFFQDYYNFNIGAYPHNIILEILITYGLIITIIIFILLFVGLKKIFFSNSELVLIDIIVLYLFLLYFKSGSLISLDVFATVFYLISHSDFTKSFNKLSNL